MPIVRIQSDRVGAAPKSDPALLRQRLEGEGGEQHVVRAAALPVTPEYTSGRRPGGSGDEADEPVNLAEATPVDGNPPARRSSCLPYMTLLLMRMMRAGQRDVAV